MKKKIQIFGNNLGFGGIEREICVLANSLADLFDVEVIFLKKDKEANIDFSKNVKLNILDIDSINIFNSKKIKNSINTSISNTIISTDVVFNKFVSKIGCGKKIYWEHNHHDNSSLELEQMKKELNGFDKIIVPNEELFNFYRNITEEVVIINNAIGGIPKEHSLLEKNNISFVGKLTEEKGIKELLEVFKLVYDKNNEAKLYIVGEGPLMNYIKEYRENNGILDNIKVLGNLNRDDIEKVLLNTSVFITCSRSESFGLSLVEAMSYGIPSIVFDDIESFKNIIEDEINGYMISDRDHNEMAKRILYLLKNKEVSLNVGGCAREKAQSFDIKILKTEWLKVL